MTDLRKLAEECGARPVFRWDGELLHHSLKPEQLTEFARRVREDARTNYSPEELSILRIRIWEATDKMLSLMRVESIIRALSTKGEGDGN